ncbi:hypothetical protein PVL29_013497 [Vitis rotundifolia]|uniref:Protein kinase domain-containing protein n=1 Tax=Vitis rotundifolia TaxID=103349 RepID=A0AA38ZLL0_VITRO|nr:hypothetical protein PVL29_013497 [Vitis rotundifolia]
MPSSISISSSTFVLLFFSFFSLVSISPPLILSASVVEDLNNLHPPSDFNSTINNNCLNNPSLRYCNFSSPLDLIEIFKSTIVASHLCNESRNPNCVETFPKIDLHSRPKIAPLYLSFTFFWKYCPLTILSINLSNNSIKGGFPSDVLQCSQIQALDLSHNDLSGDVPIQGFSPLTNLTLLNLSYNHFSESRISDSQFFKRFNSSSFLHSGLVPDHHGFTIKVVVFLFGFPIFVILMVGCLGWMCIRRPDFLPAVLRGRKHKFTPAMLKAATGGFSRNNLVGKSEGVDIYRGSVRDSSQVRIEIYRDEISGEGRRRFAEECKVLVQLCHKNIVQVVGWCENRRLRAIVTEWTGGENVEIWVARSAPPWKQRLKILMGVLEAMRYLQEQWPQVGYDLRTCSILLSKNRQPLISRFRIGDQISNTRKIYKFGMLVLEMVTNKRPREEFERGEADFIEWIRMHHPGKVHKVIDERMKKTGNTVDQATQGIGMGLMCADLSRGWHPSFDLIYRMMSKLSDSCQVAASPDHKRSHGDGGEGHRRNQSR